MRLKNLHNFSRAVTKVYYALKSVSNVKANN